MPAQIGSQAKQNEDDRNANSSAMSPAILRMPVALSQKLVPFRNSISNSSATATSQALRSVVAGGGGGGEAPPYLCRICCLPTPTYYNNNRTRREHDPQGCEH